MTALAFDFDLEAPVFVLRHCDRCDKTLGRWSRSGRCTKCQRICDCGRTKHNDSKMCVKCRIAFKDQEELAERHCRCLEPLRPNESLCALCVREDLRRLTNDGKYRNHFGGPMKQETRGDMSTAIHTVSRQGP